MRSFLYLCILIYASRVAESLSSLFVLARAPSRSVWTKLPEETRVEVEMQAREFLQFDGRFEVKMQERNKRTATVADVVWALGKLSCEPRHLSGGFMKALWQTLISGDSVKQEVSKLLFGLSLMRVRWYDIPNDARGQICALLARYAETMNEQEMVNAIYSLGKMDAKWAGLQPDARLAILTGLERVSGSMSSSALANTLWGLGRCKARWIYLPLSMRRCLSKQMSLISPLGPQALSSSIIGLSKMNATWSDLDACMRESLIDNIPTALSNAPSEQTVATLLWGLGTMDLDARKLPQEAQSAMSSSVVAVARTFTSQGLSNCLYGIARLKMPVTSDLWSSVQAALLVKLCSNNSMRSSSLLSQAISNIIWSLGQIGVEWSCGQNSKWAGKKILEEEEALLLFDSPTQIAVNRRNLKLDGEIAGPMCACIEIAANQWTEQGLANSLSGLAKVGAQLENLPFSTTCKLCEAIVRLSPEMNQQAVSNTLWALGSMGLKWQQNTQTTNEGAIEIVGKQVMLNALTEAAIRVAPTMSTQGICTTLYSMARLGCVLEKLDSRLLSSLQNAYMRGSSSMSAREISITLYSLGKMQCSFALLPSDLQAAILLALERVGSSMSVQDLGNAVWGLCGQMGKGFTQLPPRCKQVVMESFVAKQKDMNSISLVAFLQGISQQGDVEWRSLYDPLRQAILSCIENSSLSFREEQRSRRLVGNIIYAMGKMQVPWGVGGVFAPSLQLDLVSQLCFAADHLQTTNLRKSFGFGLNGLARMTSWENLEIEQRDMILSRLLTHVPMLGTYELANLCWSFARMEVSFPCLKLEVRNCLVSALETSIPHMNENELAWTMWALGKGGFAYNEMTSLLRDAIVTGCVEKVEKLERRETGIVLWALGKMKYPLSSLSPILVEKLFASIDTLVRSP